MSFLSILIEFAHFVCWPLAPMLLAYPVWALHARHLVKWRRRRQHPALVGADDAAASAARQPAQKPNGTTMSNAAFPAVEIVMDATYHYCMTHNRIGRLPCMQCHPGLFASEIESRLNSQRDTLLAQSQRISELRDYVGTLEARISDLEAIVARQGARQQRVLAALDEPL